MPSPNPRELKAANVGANLRPRSASRDLRANFGGTMRAPGKLLGSQFDDNLRQALTTHGATGKHIRVFPAVAQFNDTEPHVTHVLTVTVVNRSDKVRRIRFKPPRTAEFTLHQIPSVAVAPGLEVSADLEYFSTSDGDFADELQVLCDDDVLSIPVRAFAPRADVYFDGFCHFGGVAPESTTIRYVDLVNRGTKAADFKFLTQSDRAHSFEIDPTLGRLGPAGSDDCFIKIRVVFKASELGVVRSVVGMEVNGASIGTALDMSALVVRQKVEIVSADGAGKVNSVQFGTVYFGEERAQQIVFVNDGPESLRFESMVPKPETNEDGEPAQQVFALSPCSSSVSGFEQKVLGVSFHPPLRHVQKGWKQAKAIAAVKEEHNVVVPFSCTGDTIAEETAADMETSIRLVGCAVGVQVSLSEYDIEFVDTRQYDHVDINVTIKNENEELPIAFTVASVAHFRAKPGAGRLLPYQAMTLTIRYQPNQKGPHAGELCFLLRGASGTIVGQQLLNVRGFCSHQADHRALPGGLQATKETFKSPQKSQSPAQLALQKQTIKPKYVREKAWVKRPPEVTLDTAKYTMEAEAFEAIQQTKEQYLNWLRQQQAIRKRKVVITETVAFALGNPNAGVASGDAKDDPDYANPSLDMGMFGLPSKGVPRGAALQEPKLSLPDTNDALHLKSDSGKKYVLKPRTRVLDEDKLFTRKFKAFPTTGKEKRECQLFLSARNILQISCHPSKMDFGSVCIQQDSAKSFAISNNTENNILVRIDTHGDPALARSKVDGQIIPPGASAGFDIHLYLETKSMYSGHFTYIINENHSYEVPVSAEAVPVMLSVNKSLLSFIFPPQNFEASVSEPIMLINNGNNTAEYKFTQGKHFTTLPTDAKIDPISNQEVLVTFTPGAGTRFEETLLIDVLGGSCLELRCSGEVEEGAVTVKTKGIDYGALAAGVTVRKSFPIVGAAEGEIESVWYIDKNEVQVRCPGLSLNPENGSLSRGASTTIVAVYRSERAQKLDSFFNIYVRGSKPIKVKVKCEVIVPNAKVENDEFDFGSTYLGAQTTRQVKISNESVVDAIFTLDLRKHHEFNFVVPEELEFESDEAPADGTRSISFKSLRTQQDSKDQSTQLEEGRSAAIDSEGPLAKFKVPPMSQVAFQFTYSPVALINHAFELPLSMLGLPANAMRHLRRVVSAESSRPKLLLSVSTIDFADKIIVNENMGKFAYHLVINVTNCDDVPCPLEARLLGEQVDAGVFEMQPVSSELDIGQSCSMTINFIPRKAEVYKSKLQVFIHGDTTPYFDLDVHGRGRHPSLKFDRREIFLAPSPPGQQQKVSFFVLNDGFDNMQLRHAIPPESSMHPMSIDFPLGTMLNVVKRRLPVEVTVTPGELSGSFTAMIDFYDSNDQVYRIPLLCAFEASLMSLFPWLSIHEGSYKIQVTPGKAHRLELTSELMEYDIDDFDNIVAKAPGSPIVGSPSRSQPLVQPNAGFLCMCKKMADERSLHFILEYCNVTLFKHKITNFPSDLDEERGKAIIDIIEAGSGKQIPGAMKKIPETRKDEAVQLLHYYTEMCNALKAYGAVLALVRPDYLLPIHLFERLYLEPKSADFMSYSEETLDFLEKHYELVHKATWLIVLYQVLRLFTLARFTTKSIKALVGADSKAFPGPYTSGSNLYNSSELCLLSWLSYHKTKINPADTAPVTNFDTDLHDCRVFAAAIASHVPAVSNRLAVLKRSDALADRIQNATLLRAVMKELNLDYRPTEEVLTSSPGRDLIFFVVYLVDSLPGFIPKTLIEFEGRLNESVIQHIELTNPSAKALIYNVRIAGSSEFSAADSLKIGPRDKIKFEVACLHTSRLPAGEKIEAQIFFIGERVPGTPMGATLVFNLQSEVKSFKRQQTLTSTTKLYEQISFEVPYENIKDDEIEIDVTLVNLNNWPGSGAGWKTGSMAPSPMKKGGGSKKKVETTSHHLLPRMTFWAKKSHIKIKKGATANILVNCLPLRMAAHSCLVFVKDDKGLETCYELRVQVDLPASTENCKFAHPVKSTIVKDVPMPLKNPALDRCRTAIMELLGAAEGRAFFKAYSEQDSVEYKVEFLTNGFSGPTNLTLYGKTPPTPLEKGQKLNHLQLELRPQGVGLYVSRLCLKSSFDVRIMDVEAKVTSLGTRAELTLSIPARQQIVQEIPIINNSPSDWKIVAELQGKGFSGPKELSVPSKKDGVPGRGVYQLTFRPSWICNVDGLLLLRNTTVDDKYEYSLAPDDEQLCGHAYMYEYTLTGIGEDPVAEDHVEVECQARSRSTVRFPVRNILGSADCTYTVESDLIGMTGPQELTVLANSTEEYELMIKMPRGGNFTGSVSFLAPNKEFIWFTVEIHAKNPPYERIIELQAKARTAVAADISIVNPLDEQITFDVITNGEGLFGAKVITLLPKETVTYELIYSPLLVSPNGRPGKGGLTFLNDEIGEFWYALELTSTPSDPIVIDEIEAELGKTGRAEVVLENPTGQDIDFEVEISNPQNFALVDPDMVVEGEEAGSETSMIAVPACATKIMHLIYTASGLQKVESTLVRLQHHEAGVWEYQCSGRGTAPTQPEAVAQVSATIGSSASIMVPFRNPLKESLLCEFVLTGDVEVSDDADPRARPAFTLAVAQISHVVLEPFETLDLPIVFVPHQMTEHQCQLEVHAVKHGFSWVFPVVGTAEAARTLNLGRLYCKARESLQEYLELDLYGARDLGEDEPVEIEVITPEDTADMLSSSLTIKRDPENPCPGPGICRLKLIFEPLKAVRSKVDLLITRGSGGRWRFDLELVASQPDVDDVIKIEGNINRISSVSFALTNQFDRQARFAAYFSPDSPSEFSVSPSSGLLEPYGSEGSIFVVSFAPTVYGKFYQGKLIIETDEMQWTYEVCGDHPRYDPPQALGKVDSWIPPEVDPVNYNKRLPKQNYMQQNVASVRRSLSALRTSSPTAQPTSPARRSPAKGSPGAAAVSPSVAMRRGL